MTVDGTMETLPCGSHDPVEEDSSQCPSNNDGNGMVCDLIRDELIKGSAMKHKFHINPAIMNPSFSICIKCFYEIKISSYKKAKSQKS